MTTPNFASAPHNGAVLVNTANTNVDGTSGARADVIIGAANGTRVDTVQIKGITAEAATQLVDVVRLWIFNTAAAFLWKEILVPAGGGPISTTVANFETTVAVGMDLPSGWKIQASTHTGGATASYHVSAAGGDY